MSELSFLALAFGLGLLGFIEPCSIGANGIFLGYLQTKDRSARLFEILKFTLGRSAALGLFGLGIALMGSLIFSAQKGFWLLLGLLYLALGITVILNARFRWGLFSRLFGGRLMPKQVSHSVWLGLLFGLNLPAPTPDRRPPRPKRCLRRRLGLRRALCLRSRPLPAARAPGPLRANFEGLSPPLAL